MQNKNSMGCSSRWSQKKKKRMFSCYKLENSKWRFPYKWLTTYLPDGPFHASLWSCSMHIAALVGLARGGAESYCAGIGCSRYSVVCCGASLSAPVCTLCPMREEDNTWKVFIDGYGIVEMDCTRSKSWPCFLCHLANYVHSLNVFNLSLTLIFAKLFHWCKSTMLFQTSKKQLIRISFYFFHAVFHHTFQHLSFCSQSPGGNAEILSFA